MPKAKNPIPAGTVKIRPGILKRAKIACAIQDESLTDFVSAATEAHAAEILKKHTKNLPDEPALTGAQ